MVSKNQCKEERSQYRAFKYKCIFTLQINIIPNRWAQQRIMHLFMTKISFNLNISSNLIFRTCPHFELSDFSMIHIEHNDAPRHNCVVAISKTDNFIHNWMGFGYEELILRMPYILWYLKCKWFIPMQNLTYGGMHHGIDYIMLIDIFPELSKFNWDLSKYLLYSIFVLETPCLMPVVYIYIYIYI